MNDRRPYQYLNRDGAWPGFSWQGLELGADGTLRLMSLPALDGMLPPPAGQQAHADARVVPASAQASAGVAVARDGTIFLSDPASAAVCRIDGCSGELEPAPCLGGRGSSPTRFSRPTALLIPKHRHALYVADTGNGRIQVFDLDTMALVDVLTGFDRPVSLAADGAGNLYVVDAGAKRVDRFTSSGDLVPSFWEAVHGSGVTQPLLVACDADLVYVFDGQTHNVGVFDAQGSPIDEIETGIEEAAAMAVAAAVMYIGDVRRRRLAVFRKDQEGAYAHAGDAANYDGPVVAIVADGAGALLVLPAGCVAPVRLRIDSSYRHEGWLWSGPIRFDDLEHYWNRLHANVDLPPGSHIQFFVYTGAPSVPPPAVIPPGTLPKPWRAVANDATDFFVTLDGGRANALWLAARFNNDLHATPALSQARIDFDQEGYLPYLPAIYRERGCDDVLLRYLSLFESFFDELEEKIADLPTLLDPAAVDPEALPWLAGFLALPLPEVWSDLEQRDAIARAYERYARRGTVGGLRETLRHEARVRAVIDEPLQAMGWWAMPSKYEGCKPGFAEPWTDGGDSVLGFNTVLMPAEPQGAVVGATAVFDRSQLITQEEYGTPLFEAAAYRFFVWLYPGEIACAEKLDEVKAIIDREKPAHTAYDLCVVTPGIRVGYQARLGVDTLLGAGPTAGRLGETDLVLSGQPRGRVGIRSHVGVSTQL